MRNDVGDVAVLAVAQFFVAVAADAAGGTRRIGGRGAGAAEVGLERGGSGRSCAGLVCGLGARGSVAVCGGGVLAGICCAGVCWDFG